MSDLAAVALAGFAAALVDGALGMGFGPTSSSILLGSGIGPAAASTTVNVAKVVTGLVSGAAHWRFGNVDRRIVVRLAVPGMVGALVGAVVLTRVDPDALRPVLAALLTLIGLRILLRFSRPLPASRPDAGDGAPPSGLVAAGATGGVTNGLIGAWGPVVTPFLLHRGVPPNVVVGSVNTAEIAVAFVAAGSLLSSGTSGVGAATIVAMLVGGTLAAPLAAKLVRFVPARLLGVAVATLLLATNLHVLVSRAGWVHSPWPTVVVVGLAAVAAAAAPLVSRSTPTVDARR